jgi:hypothetical protein
MIEKAFLSLTSDGLLTEGDVMVSISEILRNKIFPKVALSTGLEYDTSQPKC